MRKHISNSDVLAINDHLKCYLFLTPITSPEEVYADVHSLLELLKLPACQSSAYVAPSYQDLRESANNVCTLWAHAALAESTPEPKEMLRALQNIFPYAAKQADNFPDERHFGLAVSTVFLGIMSMEKKFATLCQYLHEQLWYHTKLDVKLRDCFNFLRQACGDQPQLSFVCRPSTAVSALYKRHFYGPYKDIKPTPLVCAAFALYNHHLSVSRSEHVHFLSAHPLRQVPERDQLETDG